MFLRTTRGSRGTLQIQCSGELVGIINRFWQRHYFFQNVLEKSNMGVECFSHWSVGHFILSWFVALNIFSGNSLFFTM